MHDKDELIAKLLKENKDLKNKIKYGLVWEEEEDIIDTFTMNKCEEKSIYSEGSSLDHLLVEGDNLLSLNYLQESYENSIQVIYIDPPYNTGKKFTYHDSYYDKKYTYKHSDWLNFMYSRLKLCPALLKEDGVVFISIDEYEYAQLKLMCDDIFGEENYLGNIIWDKRNPKGDAKTISSRTEYILSYAKNKRSISGMKVKKDNADTILKKAKQIYRSKNSNLEHKNKEFRDWLRIQPFTPGEKMYNKIDNKGKVYRTVQLGDPSGKGGQYPVLHPETNKPCKVAGGGWRLREELMNQYINEGRIIFGKDDTTIPQRKYYLEENLYSPLTDLISYASNGSKDLMNLGFLKSEFSNPKPVYLIKKLLEFSDEDAIILDFFAGSGTTGQAVLELNKENNHQKKFILCTNNEGNICSNICYPRLEKILLGYIDKKGIEHKHVGNNLSYYQIV